MRMYVVGLYPEHLGIVHIEVKVVLELVPLREWGLDWSPWVL